MNDDRKSGFLAAFCSILGAILLIPAAMQIWKIFILSLSPQSLHYLPESHTDFILSIDGLTVDIFTAKIIVTVVGALLLVGGVRILRKSKRVNSK